MWIKGKWVKQEITLSCLHCTKLFTTTDRRVKFCSSQCKNYYNSLKYAARHKGTLEWYLKRLCVSRPLLNWKDLYELYQQQEGRCALSGVDMTYSTGNGRNYTNISIDRIKHGEDYSMNNVRLVCTICNSMRNTLSDEALFSWCEKILVNRSFARNSDSSLKSQTSTKEKKRGKR